MLCRRIDLTAHFGSGDGELSPIGGRPAVDGLGVGSGSGDLSCGAGRGVVISSESISISSLSPPGSRGNTSGGVRDALSSSFGTS